MSEMTAINANEVINPFKGIYYVVSDDQAVCPEGYKRTFLSNLDQLDRDTPIVYFASFYDASTDSVQINMVRGYLVDLVRIQGNNVPSMRLRVEMDGKIFECNVRADFWVYVPKAHEMN